MSSDREEERETMKDKRGAPYCFRFLIEYKGVKSWE